MRLYALRGATQLDSDSEEEMLEKVEAMMKALFEENSLRDHDVVSINFTVTNDLHSMNPATAYRRRGGANNIPLLCSQEPQIVNMMPRVVRALLYVYREEGEKPLLPQYLGETKKLRPDLP